MLSADESTGLTGKETIFERWTEHFNSMLNRQLSINEETRKAVQQLSSCKAPSADAIPVEVYKAGGLPMAEKLSCFTVCGGRRISNKNLMMQP